jgi:hypothetical protein
MKCFLVSTLGSSCVKINKNEVGGACGFCGGEKKCIQGFGGET